MKAEPLTVTQALKEGSDFLGPEIENPYHEALILLQFAINRSKEYLLAHPEKALDKTHLQKFQAFLRRRDHGEPIAYIVEEKEFWSLPFYVTQGVLIPRPETEMLVESVLKLIKNKKNAKVLDLGTGSGCIALSIAKEKPDTEITACDISDACLKVAQANAEKLNIKHVRFIRSHWYSSLQSEHFDVIVCNPPYIAEDDPLIEESVEKFEPDIALFSNNQGLEDIYHIIDHAQEYLNNRGTLVLEHGLNQAKDVKTRLLDHKFQNIYTLQDLQGHDRMTLGTLLIQ